MSRSVRRVLAGLPVLASSAPPRRPRPVRLALAGLLALTLTGGCAGTAVKQRTELFDRALRSYEQAIRWGEYELAAALLVRRDGSPVAPSLEGLSKIHVTAYSTVSSTLRGEQAEEAEVEALIDFYHDESGSIHRLRDRQRWWFDETSGRWLLEGGLPDFYGALKAPAS